jgi:hypothetical protein
MNTYKITYESPKNLFKGELFTEAKNSPEAMSKFFQWIQKQDVWNHLWSLHVEIQHLEKGTWI